MVHSLDIMEARQHVSNVENGLKLALLIVGGIGGAIALFALIGAAAAQASLKNVRQEPCETC